MRTETYRLTASLFAAALLALFLSGCAALNERELGDGKTKQFETRVACSLQRDEGFILTRLAGFFTFVLDLSSRDTPRVCAEEAPKQAAPVSLSFTPAPATLTATPQPTAQSETQSGRLVRYPPTAASAASK